MSIYKVAWYYLDSDWVVYSKLFADENKAVEFVNDMRNCEFADEIEHIMLVTLANRNGEFVDDVTILSVWPAHEAYERFAVELAQAEEEALADLAEAKAYDWAELTEAALLGIRLRY